MMRFHGWTSIKYKEIFSILKLEHELGINDHPPACEMREKIMVVGAVVW